MKRRISRWGSYFGALTIGGGMMGGNPWTMLLGLLLVLQYAAVEFVGGYRGGGESTAE